MIEEYWNWKTGERSVRCDPTFVDLRAAVELAKETGAPTVVIRSGTIAGTPAVKETP